MSGIIGSLPMFESPIIRIGHFRVSVHRVRNLYFFSLGIYAKCDCCSGLWGCSSWVSGFCVAGGFGSGVKRVLKTCPEIPSSSKVGSIPKVIFECLFGGSSLLSMCGRI